MDELEAKARAFATTAHEGQTDKAGEPYIGHPERVARRLAGNPPEVVAAGWLHDVVEDTDAAIGDIFDVFGFRVAVTVDAVTHREGETRRQYLDRVRANPDARLVKMADILDNADPARLRQLDEATQARLTAKYRQAGRYVTTGVWLPR